MISSGSRDPSRFAQGRHFDCAVITLCYVTATLRMTFSDWIFSLGYRACRRCSSAERFAPANNSRPDKNAQNIRLTDSANGP